MLKWPFWADGLISMTLKFVKGGGSRTDQEGSKDGAGRYIPKAKFFETWKYNSVSVSGNIYRLVSLRAAYPDLLKVPT